MKQTSQSKKHTQKKKNPLPIAAAAVVVVAAAVFLVPKLSPQKDTQAGTASAAAALSDDGSAVMIDPANVGGEATFFDYDADGTTVELFAVKASDGSVRLALNTCQVCNGSPYAYFIQTGDYFICQNCRNRFASTQVGLTSGGCNPVPITDEDYSLQDGTILISTEFLEENAPRFTNWKNF